MTPRSVLPVTPRSVLPVTQRSVLRVAWVAAAAALALVAFLAVTWSGGPPPWLPSWQPVARTLGLAAPLPAEWDVDADRVPTTPAPLDLAAPLGKAANPFRNPLARDAFDLWRDGRFADAHARGEQAWLALQGKPSDALPEHERPLFAFLLTELRASAGDRPGALAAAKVAVGHPALGSHALRYVAARADDAGLSQVVQTLGQGRLEPGMRLLRARALRRSGDLAAATAELEAIGAPKGTALARRIQLEQMRMAQVRGSDDEVATLARALLQAKSAQAEEAADFFTGGDDSVWLARLQRRPGDAGAVLDGLVYHAQRRRYARVIPALEKLAIRPDVALPVRCHARSWAARSHDRRGAFDKALAHYQVLVQECEGKSGVATWPVDEGGLAAGELAFRAGRALVLTGQGEGLAYLKRALQAGLTGLDADDARTVLQLTDKHPDVLGILKLHGVVAAQDYAERDMMDVAVWRVAMERMVAGRWADALPVLDRLAAVRDAGAVADIATTGGYDDRDWGRGRADYFAGRALAILGKPALAKERWSRVIRRHPLSYFATMSLAQLQAADKDRAVVADFAGDLKPTSGLATGPVLDAALLGQQGVQRARLLGLLGWHDAAGEELDMLGLGRDPGAQGRWAAGDPGGTWTRAAFDAEAGRFTTSHTIGRDVLRRFATAYPHDGTREAWKIAYPQAFQTLMDAAAREFGLHPSVVYAICRAESGFNPRVESHAHAIGLLQLILPTAQAMAKPLGLTADAQTLRQPAINVRLGARYLKALFTRFEREAQMAAGYNAGGGAVGRWRKQRGDWPMDLFVEAIPFKETRDYAKRVLSAIAVYRNLYDGEALHAFGLTQKPVPVADEPPTEPSSAQVPSPPARAGARGVQTPAAAVESGATESGAPLRNWTAPIPKPDAPEGARAKKASGRSKSVKVAKADQVRKAVRVGKAVRAAKAVAHGKGAETRKVARSARPDRGVKAAAAAKIVSTGKAARAGKAVRGTEVVRGAKAGRVAKAPGFIGKAARRR